MSGIGELSWEGVPVPLRGDISPNKLTGTVRGDGTSPPLPTGGVDRSPLILTPGESSVLNTLRFNLRTLVYFLGLGKSSELSSLGSSKSLNNQ